MLSLPSLNLVGEVQVAFDIGSGKVKMQVAEVRKGNLSSLYSDSLRIVDPHASPWPAGEPISEETEKLLLAALQMLLQQAEPFHPEKIWAVATDLYRRSPNGADLMQRLQNQTGISIEIISQEEEAILAFLTATREHNLEDETAVVWDVGSGSTQIVWLENGRYRSFGVPIGWKKEEKEPLFETDFFEGKTVFGIGAHPKKLLESSLFYTNEQVIQLEPTDSSCKLATISFLMEAFHISKVLYLNTLAGNTTGLFVLKNRLD